MRGQSTTTPPDAPVERLISGASPEVCAAITAVGAPGGVEAAGLGGGGAVFGLGAGAPPQLQRARTASLNGKVLMSSNYYFGPSNDVKARRPKKAVRLISSLIQHHLQLDALPTSSTTSFGSAIPNTLLSINVD